MCVPKTSYKTKKPYRTGELLGRNWGQNYLSVTFPPTSSIFFFHASASSFFTSAFMSTGALSTMVFASERPRPRTSFTILMTAIFCSPNEVSSTLNSDFSSAAGPAAGPAAEEKSEFNVELTSFGEQKIAVIKIVKEVLGLGLSEAKTMVESAPVLMKADVKKEDAEAWKKRIEEAGGKVTLK